MDDSARLEELKKQHIECRARCTTLEEEIKSIESFSAKKAIENVTLPKDSKLVDLLIERILSIDDAWKSKIDTLINIPHDLKGGEFLKGGDYFEALFQTAIAIGILPQFQGSQIQFYDITGYSKKVIVNNYLYTKPVQNSGGGEQGISDITFELVRNPETGVGVDKCGELSPPKPQTNPFYFISVKGYKKEGSIAKDYDVPLLDMQLKILPEIENKHIVVCVRNKEQFMKRLGRSRMGFLRKSINHVIGYDELINAFSIFRTNFFLSLESVSAEKIKERVLELFPKTDIYKPSLSLYFHQELVTKSVLARIKENPTPSSTHFMCVGVLPRGGKSFIAGGIVRYHKRQLKKESGYNVLFLTSAVNETREQFREDLVTKFSDFDDFEFIDIVNPEKTNPKPNKFVFVSRQLSSMSKEGEEESILNEGSFISRLKSVLGDVPTFDICFFDEAHVGIKSEKVREQFQKTFAAFKMPIILMSATYKNPAQALTDEKDLFVWDLQDIKDMKELSTVKFDQFLAKNPDVIQRYPLAKEILEARISLGETETQIAKPYVNFPVPNFISLTFAPRAITNMIDDGTGYKFLKAFEGLEDTDGLLRNPDSYMDWGNLLKNPEFAKQIRDFLTPEQESRDEFLSNTNRKYRALNQVFRIAQQTNSRPMIGKPFSIIMFLPFGGAGIPNIGELCRIWGSFLLRHRYWRDNFVMMTLSTYPGHKPTSISLEESIERGIVHREDIKKSLKDAILTVEQAALKAGKGLVLLSGDVAKMGISLKCVDVVCLLTNNTEPDDIIQKMYRALTDDPPYKKNGYIIDLNVKRIVKAIFDYDIVKSQRTVTGKTMTTEDRVTRIMELCNWGQDAFIEDNPDKDFTDIMSDIRSRVFAELLASRKLEYSTKKIAEEQFDTFEDVDRTSYAELYSTLRLTAYGKKKGKAAEVLSESGAEVPGEGAPGSNAAASPGSNAAASPKAQSPPKQGLTPAEFKKKVVDIMITFVNALVIKSDIEWDGMTFEKIIARYLRDKETAKYSCVCDEDGDVSNVYDIAFCELRGFAMKQKEESFEYDEVVHRQIMEFLDKVFQSSVGRTLAPKWTEYIETLIAEFTS